MGKIFIIFIVVKKYPDSAGRFLAQKCLFISYLCLYINRRLLYYISCLFQSLTVNGLNPYFRLCCYEKVRVIVGFSFVLLWILKIVS